MVLETVSSSETALSGQTDLIGSLSVATLDSNSDLTGVLNAIRSKDSKGAYIPKTEIGPEAELNAGGFDRGVSSNQSLSVIGTKLHQPIPRLTTANDFSSEARGADTDALTGMSRSAPLVSAVAAATRNLQIITPAPDRDVVFNRVVFSTVNDAIRTKTLTLRNTGTGVLTITGLSIGNSAENLARRPADNSRAPDFKLLNTPTSFTIAAGGFRNISIQFDPQRPATNNNDLITDTLNGENYASLAISSNDPDQPRAVVNLAGLNAAAYENRNENSVAEIARSFGWRINVGTERQFLSDDNAPIGDEVYSPYWLRANKSLPVQLWALGAISTRQDTPHGKVGYVLRGGGGETLYSFAGRNNDDNAPGSNNVSGGENQKLFPKILLDGVNSVQTASSVGFIPTRAFALNSVGSYTDDTRNGTEQVRNWRLYPVRNAQGTLVPNTWLAAKDNTNNPDNLFKNYDYNDYVFLLRNAKPESAAADFTGDAKSDVTWRNPITGANVVWQMNGTTYSSGVSIRPVADPNWRIGGTGDFTGDGKSDILWRNIVTGANVVWQMDGTTYTSGASIRSIPDRNWVIGGTGDFSGDGREDILWRNQVTGQNVIWQMNGTAYSSGVAIRSAVGRDWQVRGVADFNGDGKEDVLWRNQATGANSVWQMNGTTFASSVSIRPVVGRNWVIGGTGDYNGDGRPDILWRDQPTGKNVIWQMNGTTYSSGVSIRPVADRNWVIGGPR